MIRQFFEKAKISIYSNEAYIRFLRKQGVHIGENCFIDKTAVFGTEPYLINIGNRVRITRGCEFITHDGSLWVVRNLGLVDERADFFGQINIGDNTNIGWNTMIMPGIKIGKNCIVGCGSVVTKDIPDNSVAAGVPARVIETVDEYASKKTNACVMTKGMDSEAKKHFLVDYFRGGESNETPK